MVKYMMTDNIDKAFIIYKWLHISTVIQTSLIAFENEGIYDSPLIRTYDTSNSHSDERALETACNIRCVLYESELKEDHEELKKIYNYCAKYYAKLKKFIPENQSMIEKYGEEFITNLNRELDE